MNLTLETSLLNCKKEIFEKKFEVFPKEKYLCEYQFHEKLETRIVGQGVNLRLCINPIKMSKFL